MILRKRGKKIKRQGYPTTSYNNGIAVTACIASLHPNCQGFGGRAFVSVHLRPVSTPSLRSVGHSPQVHGTQAQIKLATSLCLNVVRHTFFIFLGGFPLRFKNMEAKQNFSFLFLEGI